MGEVGELGEVGEVGEDASPTGCSSDLAVAAVNPTGRKAGSPPRMTDCKKLRKRWPYVTGSIHEMVCYIVSL